MSRIGQKPIRLPAGVKVTGDDHQLTITGPGGSLSQNLMSKVSWSLDSSGQTLIISRADDSSLAKAGHGLLRSLAANMVQGVSAGFSKRLELNGIGYRVNLTGSELVLSVGFSHQVHYQVPADVKITVDRNLITVAGIDKQRVGQIAAEIRAIKKPEPYKGKGIKYFDEVLIRKVGKGGREA